MLAHTTIKPIERLNFFFWWDVYKQTKKYLRFFVFAYPFYRFDFSAGLTLHSILNPRMNLCFHFVPHFVRSSHIFFFPPTLFTFIGFICVFVFHLFHSASSNCSISFNWWRLIVTKSKISIRTQGGCVPTCYQRLNQN